VPLAEPIGVAAVKILESDQSRSAWHAMCHHLHEASWTWEVRFLAYRGHPAGLVEQVLTLRP